MRLTRTGAPENTIWVSGSYFREDIERDRPHTAGLKIFRARYSFLDALAELGSTDGTIVVDKLVSISADLAIPTTASLIIERGGSIDVANTKTLTINGYFESRVYSPFSGAGTVVFGANSRRTLSTPSGFAEDVHLKGNIGLEVSFETGEQTTHTVYFPFKVTVNKIRSFVTKALAATDDGTITAKNNAGTGMTNGVITIAASAAVAAEGSASPTANNVIGADEKIQLTIAKTTAGGRARVTIEFTRTV